MTETTPAADTPATDEATVGETPTVPTDDQTPDDGQDHEPADDPALAKARRQAANYRERLRTTEQDIVDHALTVAQLDARLWAAANVDLNTLRTDDGRLPVANVIEHARQLRTEYGIHTGPLPNPQQGQPSRARGTGGLADAFNPNKPR